MSRPQLRADFFVGLDGVAIPKAPPLKRAQAFAIYNRDGGVCRSCHEPVRFGGKNVSAFETIRSGEVDHTFPRARGGRNDPGNLRLLCITCNASKGAK